jgi:hypothetical protein
MTDWLYTARERFTPATADGWANYVAWIGFSHIQELVSLDNTLCADLIRELAYADWSHNVQADYRITWFHDVDYLRQRFPWRAGRDQIIAMIEQPLVEQPQPLGFTACGFDILDSYDSISVLTNCGPLPGIIDPNAVNIWGLIPSLTTVNAIAERIRTEFPEEPHCGDCRVWQVACDAEPGK